MPKEVFRLFIDDVAGTPIRHQDGSLKSLVQAARLLSPDVPSYQTVWRNLDKMGGAYCQYAHWGHAERLVLLRFVSHMLLLEQQG